MVKFLVVLWSALILSNCNSTSISENPVAMPFSVAVDWRVLDLDSSFSEQPHSKVLKPILTEASGICLAHNTPNAIWVHEDSGTDPKLFLYQTNGVKLATHRILHIGANDYEDISNGPGPEEGNYIYLADIGDNSERRPSIAIYRFKEPKDMDHIAMNTDITRVETLKLMYPKNEAHNAEALSVHPLTGEIFIFTKHPGLVNVFSCNWPSSTEETKTLTFRGEIVLSRESITASDFSMDGHKLVLKSYEHIYIWNMDETKSFESNLSQTPNLLPYRAEVQGEAFCWNLLGDSYFTLSEYIGGIQPGIKHYTKK